MPSLVGSEMCIRDSINTVTLAIVTPPTILSIYIFYVRVW